MDWREWIGLMGSVVTLLTPLRRSRRANQRTIMRRIERGTFRRRRWSARDGFVVEEGSFEAEVVREPDRGLGGM